MSKTRKRYFLRLIGRILILLICGVAGGNWWLADLMVGLTGLILCALGIVGEYIARIYDETRDRPLYIVADALGFAKEQE